MTTTTTTKTTVTDTINETNVVAISPAYLSDVTTTVTSHIATTLLATKGQTVTITSPHLYSPAVPTTKYTPTRTETSTVTLTEIDIYLQDAQGDIYSTWIIPLAPSTTTGAPPPSVYVIQSAKNQDDNDDWDNWSKGERAGLIVGVVLGTLLLSLLFWWCCRRRDIWYAQGWWPWMGQHATQPPTPGPATVQPTYVNGPLVPYGYGQPSVYPYGTR